MNNSYCFAMDCSTEQQIGNLIATGLLHVKNFYSLKKEQYHCLHLFHLNR